MKLKNAIISLLLESHIKDKNEKNSIQRKNPYNTFFTEIEVIVRVKREASRSSVDT